MKKIDVIEISFANLSKEDLIRITNEERINRKRALKIAATYNLEAEVLVCMDLCGMSPTEALAEWDLI